MALSVVGMGFAAAGYLSPVNGAIIQEVIDVLAVLNALRAAFPPKVITISNGTCETMNTNTLTPDLLQRIDAYWRAANYLSVGQIFSPPCVNGRNHALPISTVQTLVECATGYWSRTPSEKGGN